VNAKEGLAMAAVALDVIGVIDKLVHGSGAAKEIVESLKALLVSLRDGLQGKTSPQVVMAHLDTLRQQLASSDAAADAALATKEWDDL